MLSVLYGKSAQDFPKISDTESQVGSRLLWGNFMKSRHFLTTKLIGALLLMISIACAPANQQSDSIRRGATDGNNNGDPNSNTGGKRDRDRSEQANRAAAEKFFEDKIQPAFRVTAEPRCTNCHDAPRNTLGNPNAASEDIYNFAKMYALLKQGPYPNENEFFAWLIGNRTHPDPRICRTEQDAVCALAIEWWNVAFGEGSGGGSKIGEIQNVSPRGQISGYAMDPADDSVIFQVRIYIDGDKDEGTMLAEVTASQTTQVNGLSRQRGFSFRIPESMITNYEERVAYAYAVKDGEEIMLSGSPYKFIAFAPKGLNDPNVSANYPGEAQCAGCHGFNYESLYGALFSPTPLEGGTKYNNALFKRIGSQGQVPNGVSVTVDSHSAGKFEAFATRVIAWWEAEFGQSQ